MAGYKRKRGKNSWALTVDLGRDPLTGKRRQRFETVKGTSKEAEQALARLLYERDAGLSVQPQKVTFAEFADRWLTEHSLRLAPSTAKRYRELLTLHAIPLIGNTPVTKLRPLDVQAVLTAMVEKGLAARTRLQCYRVIKEMLSYAVRWQITVRNVADAVDAPRISRFDMNVPDPETLGRLFDAADETPFGTFVYLAAHTGLRRGELCGLRWRDIDFERSRLTVAQTVQWLTSKPSFRQPKTRAGRRTVTLSARAVARLRSHRQEQVTERLALGPAYNDHDLVFADAAGNPLNPSGAIRGAWRRITEAAGIPAMRIHDLRHVCASYLLADNVHPLIVSERLGHATSGITLDTYSHVLPGLQQQAADRLDKLFATDARGQSVGN